MQAGQESHNPQEFDINPSITVMHITAAVTDNPWVHIFRFVCP